MCGFVCNRVHVMEHNFVESVFPSLTWVLGTKLGQLILRDMDLYLTAAEKTTSISMITGILRSYKDHGLDKKYHGIKETRVHCFPFPFSSAYFSGLRLLTTNDMVLF